MHGGKLLSSPQALGQIAGANALINVFELLRLCALCVLFVSILSFEAGNWVALHTETVNGRVPQKSPWY